MSKKIEDVLSPTTVNEVLLLNRIKELHRDRLMNKHSFDFKEGAKDDFDISIAMNQHTLYVAAEATVEEDWRGFNIGAKSVGFKDNNLNLAYRQFVDKTVLDNMWNKYQVATMLGHLHERMIRSLAEHIDK